MGVVIVGELFSLGINLFIIWPYILCGLKPKKHYPEFEHIEEYENEQVK
jgi:HAE1 family hydrophobic/amphiphilic exporter-1/multidrug efflux pump